MSDFSIRPAGKADAALILALLKELAAYENLTDRFTTTEEIIGRDFFGDRPLVGCDLAFAGDAPAGIVTWYWTYASFAAVRGLFVEDLFVRPEFRGHGHGKAMLAYLARRAAAMGASRLDWLVLDWNASAIAFYQSLGAKQVPDWLTYRLEGDAMQRLGGA